MQITVGLVEDGDSPQLVHDHACYHLQADCLESAISSSPDATITSMGTSTLTFRLRYLKAFLA